MFLYICNTINLVLNFGRGMQMEEDLFNPYLEAKRAGIKVRLINFKKINSLLVKSVVYLRKNMNRIEKRCCLTYELVHHSRGHVGIIAISQGHSRQEEDIIRHETANKLIPETRFYHLIENCYSIDNIAQELQVTKEVIYDYLKYNKRHPDILTRDDRVYSSVNFLNMSACPCEIF
jgi:hypothetical protein